MRPLLSMRPYLIAAAAWPLLCCSPALAQVGTVMPPLGATSPFGTVAGASFGTTGIPMGATGLASPGVSPVPNGVTGTITMPSTSSGMACSTVGTSPLGTFGSPATYDGGGLAMATGTATPGTATSGGTAMSGTSASSGMSGISTSSAISATSGESTSSGMLETSGLSKMCGSGSSSMASSSSSPTSTSPTTSSAPARTGVPLGSYQIGNLGVSPPTALPTTTVLPMTGSVGSPAPSIPTMPTVPSPATSTIP